MGKQEPIVAGDEQAEAAAEIAGLIARARKAQAEIEHATQERVDELIRAMVWSVAKPGVAEEIARHTVEETQLGNYDGKYLKIFRKTRAALDGHYRRQVGRRDRGLSRARDRRLRQAGRRDRRALALDQPRGDAGDQGDQRGQGPQRHRHRPASARQAHQQAGRRQDARRAGQDGRARRPRHRDRDADAREDQRADEAVRPHPRHRRRADGEGGLCERHAGARRRRRQCGDHGRRDRRSRRRGREDPHLEDARHGRLLLVRQQRRCSSTRSTTRCSPSSKEKGGLVLDDEQKAKLQAVLWVDGALNAEDRRPAARDDRRHGRLRHSRGHEILHRPRDRHRPRLSLLRRETDRHHDALPGRRTSTRRSR